MKKNMETMNKQIAHIVQFHIRIHERQQICDGLECAWTDDGQVWNEKYADATEVILEKMYIFREWNENRMHNF